MAPIPLEHWKTMANPDPDYTVKYDAGKAPLYYLPLKPLEETARVLEFGAKKYAKDNWKKGTDWSRFISAGLRHLLAYAEGEDLDPETGLSHLGHLMCCAMFLEEYRQTKTGTDDRKGKTE